MGRLARTPVLLSILVLGTCGDALPTAADPIECDANPRQAVLELVNAERTGQGLEPLVLDVRLWASAQAHTLDMTSGDFLSHTGSDGSSPGDRITAAGYPWTGWSENVAAGQTTAEAVVQAWMNSPGHRDNILRESSEHVGIGYGFDAGTTYGHYWTMNFGASASPPETGTGCHP